MVKLLTISKAREELASLVRNAHTRLDEYVITVNGSPQAVIMSIQEYESWKETNEILADKSLIRAIQQGEKEISAKKGMAWDKVKQELLS